MVRPVIWRNLKAVWRETLRKGGKIRTAIADNTSPDVKPGEIVAKRVGDSIQNLIQNLRGRGRKRAALKSEKIQTNHPRKRAKLTKRISSHNPYQSLPDHVYGIRVSKYRVRHICYQTGTDINSRCDRDKLQTNSIGESERFGIFDTRWSWYIYRSKYSSIYSR